MIRTDKLCKNFGRVHALRDASLTVTAGSSTALIGVNGAGKSTLIRVLMNLLQPDRGSATVLGIDSREMSHRELRQIGYAAESQEMPARLATGDYIAYLRTFYPSWDRDMEGAIVRRIGLPMDARIGGLSHGMRMKMAMVCALAFRPQLLILDEPLSGLDPLVRDDVVESLLEQAGETTILISSQELGEIENLSTHVAMIEEGRVLFEESMEALRDRFREVRVTWAGEARRPAQPPPEWLSIEARGNVLSFVETRFSEDGLSERVCAGAGEAPGEVRRIEAQAMPLRTIFTTLARASRERTRS